MKYKIEICKSNKTKKSFWYWWRIVAENGKIVATSETYNTRHGCVKTAKNVSKYSKFPIVT